MKSPTFLLIGLLSISTIAFAKWSPRGTIDSVYSHNGFHVVVTTINDNPCGTPGKFWWPADDPDAKDMLSLALTALASQKEVAFVYNENTPNCSWNGQLATHLVIHK